MCASLRRISFEHDVCDPEAALRSGDICTWSGGDNVTGAFDERPKIAGMVAAAIWVCYAKCGETVPLAHKVTGTTISQSYLAF
jgi:hypothetical protein